MKRRKPKPRVFKRPCPDGWLEDLHRIIDAVYEAAYSRDWTWADLARFADVSYYTVWRLGERDTRYPQTLTIWKLAKAVGMSVKLVSNRPNLTKDRKQIAKLDMGRKARKVRRKVVAV